MGDRLKLFEMDVRADLQDAEQTWEQAVSQGEMDQETADRSKRTLLTFLAWLEARHRSGPNAPEAEELICELVHSTLTVYRRV